MDDHTTLLEREIAPGVAGGAPVGPEGQDPVFDAERLEPLEPGQLGLLHPVRLLDGLIGEHLAHGGVDPALRQGGSKGSVTHAGLFLSHGLFWASGPGHRR